MKLPLKQGAAAVLFSKQSSYKEKTGAQSTIKQTVHISASLQWTKQQVI